MSMTVIGDWAEIHEVFEICFVCLFHFQYSRNMLCKFDNVTVGKLGKVGGGSWDLIQALWFIHVCNITFHSWLVAYLKAWNKAFYLQGLQLPVTQHSRTELVVMPTETAEGWGVLLKTDLSTGKIMASVFIEAVCVMFYVNIAEIIVPLEIQLPVLDNLDWNPKYVLIFSVLRICTCMSCIPSLWHGLNSSRSA